MFCMIDLRSSYHKLSIKAKGIPHAAFRTCYGHYMFLVMSFGLCSASTTFMDLMNHIFMPYQYSIQIIFIDDNPVYSKIAKEHKQ